MAAAWSQHTAGHHIQAGHHQLRPARPTAAHRGDQGFLKGQQWGIVFLLLPTYLVQRERIYDFFHVVPILTEIELIQRIRRTLREKIFCDAGKIFKLYFVLLGLQYNMSSYIDPMKSLYQLKNLFALSKHAKRGQSSTKTVSRLMSL